jgi:hypothetical protein
MANSKIIITFLEVPNVNYTVNFGETNLSMLFMERFRPNRVSSNQVTIPQSTLVDDEIPFEVYNGYSANNFKNAFNIDYNSSNLFTVTAEADPIPNALNGKGKVTIEANYPNAFFTYIDNELGIIDVEIINESVSNFEITEMIVSEATNPCTHVQISVETSVLATLIQKPVVIEDNTENPFVFEVLRGQGYELEIYDDNGNVISDFFRAPPFLSASNFQLNISNSPNGATASVVNSGPTVLQVEYSLDNDEWQTSNVFSGLEEGDYTLYVRDSYGCSFSINFNVNDSAVYVPHFYISKSNSIPFAQRVTFGDASNYKNDENTLSCEADVLLPYKQVVLFQTADIIQTQFESNYSNIVAKVLKENPVSTTAKSNDLLYSNDLTNTVWTKTRVNINSSKVIATNVLEKHFIEQSITKDAVSENYTFSAFVKKSEYDIITIGIYQDGGPGQSYTAFNITTESFLFGFAFGGFNFVSSSFTYEGDGFYRIAMTIELNESTDILLRLNLHNQSGDTSFTGNNLDGIFIEKLQFQKGNLTPYLQTASTPEAIEATDGNVLIPVIQKTNNIGIKDKRDAFKFNLGDGKTGIYFLAGNIYNYDTNVVNGSHSLNGTLPEWAKIGAFINISEAWFIIENIFFDEDKNADILVINQTYTGIDASIIVGCIYNIFDYEIYEFAIDMVDYIGERIRVKLDCEDDNFGELNFLSEEISVEVRHKDTLCIDYWNNDNTDVFYATGIRHRIRIPFTRVEGYIDEESTINKKDTNTILLNAMLYKGKKFIFEPQTESMWEKLVMALSHRNVFIDNVKFTKGGDFETEGPLEQSNLYVLTAPMLKDSSAYSTKGSAIINGSSSDVEIPGIIEGDAGFIRY